MSAKNFTVAVLDVDLDDFGVKEVPILVRTDVFDSAWFVIVDVLRRID
jgi:hypothetical protein